jgi:hypothetical protein
MEGINPQERALGKLRCELQEKLRQRQSPHFNLWKKEFIQQAITVAACQRKEVAMRLPLRLLHTCQRGRKRYQEYGPVITDLLADVDTQITDRQRHAMVA